MALVFAVMLFLILLLLCLYIFFNLVSINWTELLMQSALYTLFYFFYF